MNSLKKEDQVDVSGWWKTKEALYPNLARTWGRLVTVIATLLLLKGSGASCQILSHYYSMSRYGHTFYNITCRRPLTPGLVVNVVITVLNCSW